MDKDLKPCYDDLLARTAKDTLYAGFKLIRAEDSTDNGQAERGEQDAEEAGNPAADDSGEDRDASPDADADAPQTLYWFYFPIAGKGYPGQRGGRGDGLPESP